MKLLGRDTTRVRKPLAANIEPGTKVAEAFDFPVRTVPRLRSLAARYMRKQSRSLMVTNFGRSDAV